MWPNLPLLLKKFLMELLKKPLMENLIFCSVVTIGEKLFFQWWPKKQHVSVKIKSIKWTAKKQWIQSTYNLEESHEKQNSIKQKL